MQIEVVRSDSCKRRNMDTSHLLDLDEQRPRPPKSDVHQDETLYASRCRARAKFTIRIKMYKKYSTTAKTRNGIVIRAMRNELENAGSIPTTVLQTMIRSREKRAG